MPGIGTSILMLKYMLLSSSATILIATDGHIASFVETEPIDNWP